MAFLDTRQFLVTVEGLDGSFWAQITGGDATVPDTKAYDGGNPVPQVVTGNPVVNDLTVTRNYDPAVIGNVYQSLKQQLMSGKPFVTTITQSPTDPAYNPLSGPPDRWQGKLKQVTTPKADAMKTGAASATVALVFTITAIS